tara:strand:+ start:125 stop:736 length:612 start_codon:yes stop_codon:yes gene_type:complete
VNLKNVKQTDEMTKCGLTKKMVADGMTHAYSILDTIDAGITKQGEKRLAELVELANYSSIFGNLICTGIVKNSSKIFKKNRPHAYPDILANNKKSKDIEIKVALEKNKPKGHLAKAGYYITIRYVLGDYDGNYKAGTDNRGDVIWIYEIQFGYLRTSDFNLSNTAGDSGKTAVINKEGWKKLKNVYLDRDFFDELNPKKRKEN